MIISRITVVEQEWRVASLAVADLGHRSRDDPTILAAATVAASDVRSCLRNLEPTYIVRMFAVFEEALREIWLNVYNRKTRPDTYVLISRCASRQHVPSKELDDTQMVRDYRNSIVHGGSFPSIPLPEARTANCKFFGRMPPQW